MYRRRASILSMASLLVLQREHGTNSEVFSMVDMRPIHYMIVS